MNTNQSKGTVVQRLVAFNSKIYFAGSDNKSGDSNRELWSSDGTEGGTSLFKEIRPGEYGGMFNHPTVVNSTLYFVARNATDGEELWKTDGTADGTIMVKDIHPTSRSNPTHLTPVGSRLRRLTHTREV